MKYFFLGLFGAFLSAVTLFIVPSTAPNDLTKAERDTTALGQMVGVITGLASLVGLLTYLTLTRGY